jgi:hypothetical protein
MRGALLGRFLGSGAAALVFHLATVETHATEANVKEKCDRGWSPIPTASQCRGCAG